MAIIRVSWIDWINWCPEVAGERVATKVFGKRLDYNATDIQDPTILS